jgi:G3E family GTPase
MPSSRDVEISSRSSVGDHATVPVVPSVASSAPYHIVIPLVLLAGFLGAGKTRFLTDVIPLLHARGIRVRVILNDFENANIDASRLSTLNALVTPLNGECMCCTSLTELLNTLYAVPVDPGSVMLIEANGATETDELLTFLTQETRLAQFTLPLQLTVIDAGRWQKRWFHNALEVAQTKTATHVQLNWTHKVKQDRLAMVEIGLRAVNAHALSTTPALFADFLAQLVDEVRDVPKREMHTEHANASSHLRAHESADAQSHPHVHSHDTVHRHPFASASIPLPAVVKREAFQLFVRGLPNSVVRAKGVVYFSDTKHKMFIWSKVQGRKGVQLDEVASDGAALPTALFIGAALPIQELSDGIQRLRLP